MSVFSKLLASFEEADKFFLHVFVNVAVSGEGFASFFVAAERTNKVGVFHFLVEVADESTSGKMATGDFVQGTFFLFSRCRIENRNHSRYATEGKNTFYRHVVFLRADEREEFAVQVIASGIFLNQCFGAVIKWHSYHLRTFSFSRKSSRLPATSILFKELSVPYFPHGEDGSKRKPIRKKA